MYLSVVKIDACPGKENTVIDVLESMKGPTAAISGCLGCLLTVEVGAGNTICYQEQWCDREALDRHLSSNLYLRVLAAMEMSTTQPLVEFFEVTKTGGLELVEIVRNAKKCP